MLHLFHHTVALRASPVLSRTSLPFITGQRRILTRGPIRPEHFHDFSAYPSDDYIQTLSVKSYSCCAFRSGRAQSTVNAENGLDEESRYDTTATEAFGLESFWDIRWRRRKMVHLQHKRCWRWRRQGTELQSSDVHVVSDHHGSGTDWRL